MTTTTLVTAIMLSLTSAADAEDVVAFGDRTPCINWLTMPSGNPEQYRQISSWILGFWSGLNVAAAMRHEPADIGRTLLNEDALRVVWAVCNDNRSITVGPAVTLAWSQTRARQR